MWRSLLVLFAAAALWSSCRMDPVIQDQIDKLPPEDAAGPSAEHRAGQPCVLCHSTYEAAEPEMAIGGTIYAQDLNTLQLAPVEGVFVTIYDSNGASQKACTNSAGNFYLETSDWPDAAFPLTIRVGNRFMRSLIGRERSCAGCHTLATPSRVANDPTVDASTGQSRDSAGAVLVDPDNIPPEERCGKIQVGSPGTGGAAASGTGGADAGGAAATGGAPGTGGAAATGGAPGTGGSGGAGATGGGQAATGGTGGTP